MGIKWKHNLQEKFHPIETIKIFTLGPIISQNDSSHTRLYQAAGLNVVLLTYLSSIEIHQISEKNVNFHEYEKLTVSNVF